MKVEMTEAQVVNDMGLVATVKLVDENVISVEIRQPFGWNDWNDFADAVRRVMLMMDVKQP